MAENTYVEPTYWGDKLSGKLKLSAVYSTSTERPRISDPRSGNRVRVPSTVSSSISTGGGTWLKWMDAGSMLASPSSVPNQIRPSAVIVTLGLIRPATSLPRIPSAGPYVSKVNRGFPTSKTGAIPVRVITHKREARSSITA